MSEQAVASPSPLDLDKLKRFTAGKQGAIAKAAGISQSALSRIIAGKSDPPISTIDRIASALGKPARSLFR